MQIISKYRIWIGLVVILLLVSSIYFIKDSSVSNDGEDTPTPVVVEDDPVEPTDDETDDDMTPEDPITLPDVKEETEGPDTTSLKSVTPQMTSAYRSGNQLFARGFLPSVVENGGICEFQLVNNSGSVIASKSTVGFVDVASTVCPAGIFDVSGIQSGAYDVILDYESGGYQGISEAYEVEI